MKKITLSLFLILSMINISLSQTLEQKNLISIIYLQSNSDLNNEIESVFKKSLKKGDRITYQISNKLNFIDVDVFKEDLMCCIEGLAFDFELLNNRDAFRNKFQFESEVNTFSELLPNRQGSLIAHFSKPIGNLLVIELSDRDFSSLPFKQGKALKIIFLFDDKGLVDKVFTKTLIYN